MEEIYEPPYKYLWRKYMKDYLHEIKDASDLRSHLIKTKNYQFTWHLTHEEVLVWNKVNKRDEFFREMINQGSEFVAELGISSYDDFAKKYVLLSLSLKCRTLNKQIALLKSNNYIYKYA